MKSKHQPWIDAITPPKATDTAYKVFSFLRSNRDEAEIVVSGMQSFVKGLDKLYLYKLADEQGILDMRRYEFAIDYYKSKILKQQAEASQKQE